ncbi:hypothetical protein [Streptomyces flavofungini]|uniref:hypothetical protein n=1 Tax=Streptomyces flavofungini TaxID=68200 RepID=UPI0019AB5FCF|nr:hypothetical protein [Streptomyces flavofungini]GHC86224.1 hypothetical protein GCM10010349_72180 [Streptomyces flavofungini]
MGELIDAAVGFPGVAFTSAMVVVLCFWLLVAVGIGRPGSFDEDADLGAFGLGGVPVSVAVSLLVGTGWVVSLAGSVALARTRWSGLAHAAGDLGLLVVAALVAYGVTRVLVRLLARGVGERARSSTRGPDGGTGPAPRDFVGSVCTVRTEWVDAESGRAEVAAPDGSVVVVEVRQDPAGPGQALAVGSSALLHAYDDAGAFFWAAPCTVALAPGRSRSDAGRGAVDRPGGPADAEPSGDAWPHADCA